MKNCILAVIAFASAIFCAEKPVSVPEWMIDRPIPKEGANHFYVAESGVGSSEAEAKDKAWERALKNSMRGAGIMVISDNGEQVDVNRIPRRERCSVFLKTSQYEYKVYVLFKIKKDLDGEDDLDSPDGVNCASDDYLKTSLNASQDFTKLERLGTFALNHVFGLGSLLIMDDYGSAGGIALFESIGVILCVFGFSVKMPDISSYPCPGYYAADEECPNRLRRDKNDYGYETDRENAVILKYLLLSLGFASFGGAEIWNAISSFTHNKSFASTEPSNFRLAVLPNRNGNGMAYGLVYNMRF